MVIKPGVSERVVPDLSDDNNRAGITSKELTVFGSVFTVMHSGKEEKWVRFVKPDGTMVFTREESPGGERLARITLVRK